MRSRDNSDGSEALARFLLLGMVLLLEHSAMPAGELPGHPTKTSITVSVTAQLAASSAALLLVLGNHEGGPARRGE